MVIPLRPSKFYGSSLPRPRFYTDIKFSDERVDPPVPVLDPLMSWAEEAHWSMGGLSFNRLRLQGKIEGNVKKLRKEREISWGKKMEKLSPVSESKKRVGVRKGAGRVDSPPDAPLSKKRRQRKFVEDEEEEFDDEESEGESEEDEFEFESKMKDGSKKRRRLVRKLGDDFELVGDKNPENGGNPLKGLSNGGGVSKGVAGRTRSRRSMVVMDEEKDDDDEEVVVKKEMNVVENAKVVNSKKKNRSKSSSDYPKTGSRSSPRLKK